MNINRDNFSEAISEFEQKLKGSVFISIDCEFTGLIGEEKQEFLDTLQATYGKLKKGVTTHIPNQIGICLFSLKENQIVVSAFNFNVFPFHLSHFGSQPSSLVYLASHNFDFNQWIGKGIPWINEAVEDMRLDLSETPYFKRVIDLLVEHKKPLVGHNCALDMMHIYHHFIEPLPKRVQAFKTKLLEAFPVIYDTKHLSRTTDARKLFNGKSTVESCFNYYARDYDLKFPVVIDEDHKRYGPYIRKEGTDEESPEFFHEAGYDAFCTGIIFLAIVHYLAPETPLDQTLVALSDQNSEYAHKIHMMNSYVSFMDLVSEQGESQAHIFLVSEIREDMRTSELKRLLHESEVGGIELQWHERRRPQTPGTAEGQPESSAVTPIAKNRKCYAVIRDIEKVDVFEDKMRSVQDIVVSRLDGEILTIVKEEEENEENQKDPVLPVSEIEDGEVQEPPRKKQRQTRAG